MTAMREVGREGPPPVEIGRAGTWMSCSEERVVKHMIFFIYLENWEAKLMNG